MTTRTKPLAMFVDVVEAPHHEAPALLREAGFEVGATVATRSEEVVAAARAATALLVGDCPVTRDVIASAPDLRIVSTASAGTDHIDLGAARQHGVWVSNLPDVSTEEVAVHALAMMLSLLRQLPRFDRQVRTGGWDALQGPRPARPSCQTLGIIGLGRIGSHLASLARPVFGRVLGFDPVVTAPPEGVLAAELDELLVQSHVVSLHVPLTDATRGLIGREQLDRMRADAVLVNVSRGGLVDQAALLAALDSGRLVGAALDVLANEPPGDDPLLAHPSVLLSPHAAYLSAQSERDSLRLQAENVVAWARTGRPVAVVVEGRQ
jgi:D-3-phosphoglycerate dehydrogenase